MTVVVVDYWWIWPVSVGARWRWCLDDGFRRLMTMMVIGGDLRLDRKGKICDATLSMGFFIWVMMIDDFYSVPVRISFIFRWFPRWLGSEGERMGSSLSFLEFRAGSDGFVSMTMMKKVMVGSGSMVDRELFCCGFRLEYMVVSYGGWPETGIPDFTFFLVFKTGSMTFRKGNRLFGGESRERRETRVGSMVLRNHRDWWRIQYCWIKETMLSTLGGLNFRAENMEDKALVADMENDAPIAKKMVKIGTGADDKKKKVVCGAFQGASFKKRTVTGQTPRKKSVAKNNTKFGDGLYVKKKGAGEGKPGGSAPIV